MNKNDFFDFFDFFDLYEFADKKKNNYQKASPFPHVVIDRFLPKKTYNRVKKAFPKNNEEIRETPSNLHTIGRSVTKKKLFEKLK